MRRVIFGAALSFLTFPVFAQQPQPQPGEIISALNLKVQVLTQNLDQAYLMLAKQQAEAAAADASTKWMLDNWWPKAPAALK